MNEKDLDALVSKDDKVMRLAHPLRCGAALPRDQPPWERVFGPHTWSEMRRVFAKPGVLSPTCLDELINDPRNRVLKEFATRAAYSEASTEMGSAFSTFVYLRQVMFPQPYFLIDDALVEMLDNTDIADDIPVSALKPPYERCFIEFGRSRTVKERVANITTGLHVLEGAYVETGISPHHGQGIYVMFTGSPLGMRDALDDATDSMFLPTFDEQMPIRDALAWAHKQSMKLTAQFNLRHAPAEYTKYSFSCLKLLVKTLLYLGMPEVRTSFHPERTEFAKQLQAKKNPAKRAKAERQLKMLGDYVLVSAPPVRTEGLPPGSRGTGVKAHWRRGHYRMQAHGPQHSLRKLILIEPVLVGTLASGEAPPPPKYVVR